MILKPLSEPGVPFSELITIDHSVTGLVVLPEGSFYSVECLLLNPATGLPYRPMIDYMFFQQDVLNARITSKQIASIIHIRNAEITEVVVKGRYSHGITQDQLDHWNALTISHKDVPLWMNWIACLDDELQVHPNVKRMVTEPSMDKRTLIDVELEMNYIADQFMDGDSLCVPHVEYWQQQLFLIAENHHKELNEQLVNYLDAMRTDLNSKVGDFRFTDGDGVVWSENRKNQYHGMTLRDRGIAAIGTYSFLPEGGAIPARRANLFQRVNNVQNIVGLLTTNKTEYFGTDTISITLDVTQLTNRVSTGATLQVVDPDDEKLIAVFPIPDFRVGTTSYQVNLTDVELGDFEKDLIIRVPEYMWIDPVIVKVEPRADPSIGYITASLEGHSQIGAVEGGGFVDNIIVNFKRVGTLREPQKLYVRLSGNYTDDDIKPGYPPLQEFNFPVDFDESEEIVAEFKQHGIDTGYIMVGVDVSKSDNPVDTQAIIASNVWYVSRVPITPYIKWHFAKKEGEQYIRVGSLNEGTDAYAIGTMSVDPEFYPSIPQLTVTSKGVGSAIEGVDFIIDRANPFFIKEDQVAYKIQLPLKPEQEIQYKFFHVKSENSNTAELWIVDVVQPGDITAYWSKQAILNAPATDWVSETDTFYLHIQTPNLVDGTVLNVSLDSPELYRPHLTYPSTATVFGGMVIVELKLNAPFESNPEVFIKMLIKGPNINYTTLGVRVLDTNKPYYEIRYVVDGVVDTISAKPGSVVRCQVRCIKAPGANGAAAIFMSGSAVTVGNNMDFVVDAGVTSILLDSFINTTVWTDIFVTPLTVKDPMRENFLTLTTSIVFPSTGEVANGRNTSHTLNMRK